MKSSEQSWRDLVECLSIAEPNQHDHVLLLVREVLADPGRFGYHATTMARAVHALENSRRNALEMIDQNFARVAISPKATSRT